MTKEECKAMFIAKAMSKSMGIDPEELYKEASEYFDKEWAEAHPTN